MSETYYVYQLRINENECDNYLMQLYCLCRCTFTVEQSFVICDNLMFGRRSFKGFNPEIEVYVVICAQCADVIS